MHLGAVGSGCPCTHWVRGVATAGAPGSV